MKIAIGSDHGGFELKEAVARALLDAGHEVSDQGCHDTSSVDYPDYAEAVCRQVTTGLAERGILICGTGIGISIAANKVKGIRAALVHSVTTARLSAEHNNANVLCLGGRLIAAPLAMELVNAWLGTEFEPRHQHRLDKITALEGE